MILDRMTSQHTVKHQVLSIRKTGPFLTPHYCHNGGCQDTPHISSRSDSITPLLGPVFKTLRPSPLLAVGGITVSGILKMTEGESGGEEEGGGTVSTSSPFAGSTSWIVTLAVDI